MRRIQNVCKYRYSYGDQSFSKGDVATETISIDSASGSPVSFPGTVFGCGYNNGGTFDETGSGSSVSVAAIISNLPARFVDFEEILLLLVSQSIKSPYLLLLDARSHLRREEKDPYTGSSYNPNNGGIFSETSGNIIIDSGTTLTLLDSGFFDRFGVAVEESVTGAKRVSDPQGLLSHCFKSGSAEIGLPEITCISRAPM
ncbi:unnamed protein product [Arabidopsis arenosa]|uniref:Xylanase inhibitor N-terminal domain-containing protein n=1 Tax=Arabidopsis arenosa TaxID=38785 RepID=A0A8S2ADR8_ARAAE|nr:unnamed protein product [Arabidopsis arenosa]